MYFDSVNQTLFTKCTASFTVSQCSGLGASFCYMLSYLVGRPVVYRYLTERVEKCSPQVRPFWKEIQVDMVRLQCRKLLI